jgi:cytochrome c-type protein NapB
MVSTVLLAAAFAGFFVGTAAPPPGPDTYLARRTLQPKAWGGSDVEIRPAPTYAEIPLRAEARAWPGALSVQSHGGVSDVLLAAPATPPSPAEKRMALAERATRRAFAGAPPVVPHPVDARRGDAACTACHGDGLALGVQAAPRMSHAFMASCTQCHVERHASELTPREAIRSGFTRLDEPEGGERAWPGAPPVIPHGTRMRSDCLSCHGPLGREALRTTHPERASCTQCHAPSAALDQRGP